MAEPPLRIATAANVLYAIRLTEHPRHASDLRPDVVVGYLLSS
jgi:hypothetical protein